MARGLRWSSHHTTARDSPCPGPAPACQSSGRAGPPPRDRRGPSAPVPDDPSMGSLRPLPLMEPVEPTAPPPEHSARITRLLEQGLPPALRGDGAGFA